MTRATRETVAGRRYLDLQRAAQKSKRPTDELIATTDFDDFETYRLPNGKPFKFLIPRPSKR